MDDIWHSDEEYETTLRTIELNQLQQKYHKLGLREGILNNKKDEGQVGFDNGFALGLNMGKKIGQVYGVSWLLKNHLEKQKIEDDLKSLKKLSFKSKIIEIDQIIDKDILLSDSIEQEQHGLIEDIKEDDNQFQKVYKGLYNELNQALSNLNLNLK